MNTSIDKERRQAKAAEFLWIVQTAVLRSAANVLKTDQRQGFKNAVEYSGSGLFICIDEAVRAAGLIPADMDAVQAGKEFTEHWTSKDGKRDPRWFSRYGTERHDYSAVGKAEQFLWIVQTVILADAENKSARDPEGKKPVQYSGERALQVMSEAIAAARKIPADKTVSEAANEFCAYVIGEKKKPPAWAP